MIITAWEMFGESEIIKAHAADVSSMWINVFSYKANRFFGQRAHGIDGKSYSYYWQRVGNNSKRNRRAQRSTDRNPDRKFHKEPEQGSWGSGLV